MRLAVVPLLLLLPLLAACGGDDPIAAASCLCEAGREGKTVWCEVDQVGWVAGKQVATKARVDKALSEEVAANAKAKGQSGEWIDAIVADVASGTVKQKKCRCESCEKGETRHEVDADEPAQDKPGP